jgi:hypothetical protein
MSDEEPPTNVLPALAGLYLSRFAFLRIARVDDFLEHFEVRLVEEARSLGADLLVFCDRPWLGEHVQLSLSGQIKIALLSFNSFDDWVANLSKDTRYEIRKGNRQGIVTRVLGVPSGTEAEQILSLYQEDAFREGRYFAEYDKWTLSRVLRKTRTDERYICTVALYEDRIVGFSKVKFKGQVAVVSTMLSSISARREIKGIGQALLSKQVKMLSNRGVRYFAYGKLGVGLTGLDFFKISHGFKGITVNYNYIPLTRKAKFFAKCGFYQPPDIMFSTKLRSVVPLIESVQHHLPLRMIQGLHLYA